MCAQAQNLYLKEPLRDVASLPKHRPRRSPRDSVPCFCVEGWQRSVYTAKSAARVVWAGNDTYTVTLYIYF